MDGMWESYGCLFVGKDSLRKREKACNIAMKKRGGSESDNMSDMKWLMSKWAWINGCGEGLRVGFLSHFVRFILYHLLLQVSHSKERERESYSYSRVWLFSLISMIWLS